MPADLSKPQASMWAGPGSSGNDWSWAWRHPGHLAIYWDGAGPPWDYKGRVRASNVTGSTWSPTVRGIGFKRDASADRIVWADRSEFQLDGDIEFSVALYIVIDSYDGSFRGWMSARDAFTDGLWEIYSQSGGEFNFKFDSALNGVQWPSGTAPSADGLPHTMVISRKIGGTYELWVDGISKGTQSSASVPTGTNPHDLAIATLATNVSDGIFGTVLASAVWKNFAISDAQARQWHRDPFGPFRPAWWESPVLAPVEEAPPAAGAKGQLTLLGVGS